MKKKYTLFFVFIMLFFCELSAQNSKSLKSTEPINTNAAPKPTVDEQQVLKQISQIDSHLLAIETKRNYILSDPAEKASAQEQGWFEEMKKIEKSLLKKKEKLTALINN
jgi:flagellar motor protein MotB